MRQYDSSHKVKDILQQPKLELSKYFNSHSDESQRIHLTKNLVPKTKVLHQSILENNLSLSPNYKNEASEQPNQLTTLVKAISYCLNTQSKVAETIADISLCLKEFSEEMLSSSRKQIHSSHTSSNHSLTNVLSKPRDNLVKIHSIQTILSGLEILKKDITSKICEFEKYLSTSNLNATTQMTQLNSHLDEFPQNSSKKLLFLHEPTGNTPIINKHSNGKSESNNPNGQITPSNRFGTLPSDFNKSFNDKMNDTLNMNKIFFEIPSTENNHFIKLNASLEEATTHVKSVEDAMINPSSNKSIASNVHTEIDNFKAQEGSETDKTTTDKHRSDLIQNSLKKKITSSNSQEISLKAKPSSESKINQISHKKTENYIQTDGIQFSVQNASKKDFAGIMNQRGIEKTNNLTRHRITPSVGFTKEVKLDFGLLKNAIKPELKIIPQKQIVDEVLPENPADQMLMKSDRSTAALNDTSQYSNFQAKLQNNDTDRAYFALESGEYLLHQHTQTFLRNTAKKEKVVIKSLMKELSDENVSFLNNCDKTKIFQKRCLINAKWWRAWKEFVNFDADDDSNTKSSFLEIALYPRPGPINNRELLRQEAVSDLVNLTSELELKENLLEHHDYEGVSKKAYDVLAKWYGSDFEICRILRPDPFLSDKPYLELYPSKFSELPFIKKLF